MDQLLERRKMRKRPTKYLKFRGALYRKADLLWSSLEDPDPKIMDSRVVDHLGYVEAYEGLPDSLTFMAEPVSLDSTLDDAQDIVDRYGLDIDPIEPDDSKEDVWDDVVQALAVSGKKTYVVGEQGTYDLGLLGDEFGWIIELDEEAIWRYRDEWGME